MALLNQILELPQSALSKQIPKDIKSFQVNIDGSIIFFLKIKKAINILSANAIYAFDQQFPIKEIASSDRLILDTEMGILYLSHFLKPQEMADIFANLIENDALINKYDQKIQHHIDHNSKINRFFRKCFRVSLENKIDEGLTKILNSSPKGRVATPGQHFLMNIIRILMFIKSILVKIEKKSVIKILIQNKKKYQKALLANQKLALRDQKSSELMILIKDINCLDALIRKKRLLLQNRFIDRVVNTSKKVLTSSYLKERTQNYLGEHKKLTQKLQKLENLKEKLNRYHRYPQFIYLLMALINKRITTLQKTLIKTKYLLNAHKYTRFSPKSLGAYFDSFFRNGLLPPGYTPKKHVALFNLLRFSINGLFIGGYLSLISVPRLLFPIFAVIGAFVFQPLANKFALLLLSLLKNNDGLKRLNGFKLKQIIEKKASKNVNNRYFCTIDLPIYTGSINELYTIERYIRRNILNLRPTINFLSPLGIIYLIVSNTDSAGLIDQEMRIVKKMQNEAECLCGRGKIFFIYLHRKTNTAKKVGNIIAAHLFKHHGLTSAPIYQDPELFQETLGAGPLFDRVVGNISESLCASPSKKHPKYYTNKNLHRMILQGERIPIDNHLEFTFSVDNKNELLPASLEKSLAIMLHPENENIVILQPQVCIEDPVAEGQKITSTFLRMSSRARLAHNSQYLNTLHGLFDNMSAYYGKGMIRIKHYNFMIENELLNLKYVDSHDWQESVFNYTALAISGDRKIHTHSIDENHITLLIERNNESELYWLSFNKNECIVKDEYDGRRTFSFSDTPQQAMLKSVIQFLDNGVEVTERELISTIGHFQRDTRWLKGDLQMFNTIMPDKKFLPLYHRFHLEQIFRRLWGDIVLCAWVLVNFLLSGFMLAEASLHQEILFLLTLYLILTAFGFAGIDLFIYPIFHRIKRKNIKIPISFTERFIKTLSLIFTTLISGMWQFIIYILIAWPRIIHGAYSTIKIHLSGLDSAVKWGKFSNSGISVRETSKEGIPFRDFVKFYKQSLIIAIVLTILSAKLILDRVVYGSILFPLNLGLIIISLFLGPFVSYLISKKIILKGNESFQEINYSKTTT